VTERRPVVIGGGVAGYSAARRLAAAGIQPRLVSLSGQVVDRPPLSKSALTTGQLPVLADASRLADEGIELVLGRATAIDPDQLRVRVTSGDGERVVGGSHLIVATGCSYVAPPIPGMGDAIINADPSTLELLQKRLAGQRRFVVIGGGLVGVETAAHIRTLGHDVRIVDALPHPLHRLRPRIRAAVQHELARLEITFVSGASLTAVEEKAGAYSVRTSVGDFSADVVIAATGGRPEIPTGLGLAAPVDVDAAMRVHRLVGVHVVGDVARAQHSRYGRIWMPHWTVATQQAEVAARAVLGESATWSAEPHWWSDIADLHIVEYGYAPAALSWDEDDEGVSIGRDGAGAVVCVTLFNQPTRVREARRMLRPEMIR